MTEPEAATTPAPDRIVTVPNALSVLRLALIPVFVWLLLVEKADGHRIEHEPRRAPSPIGRGLG